MIGALQAVLVPPPLAVLRPARRSGWFVTGEHELSYQLLNVGARSVAWPVTVAGGSWLPGEELAAMKIALLGTGFGQAHAAVYAPNADYLPARADWIIALSAYRSSFRAQCAATTGSAHAATRKRTVGG